MSYFLSFILRFVVGLVTIGNPTIGQVITTRLLDREDVSLYQLTLVAQDRSSSPLSSTVPLTISILDVNDNSPAFSRPSWTFNLPENTNGTLIMDFNVCFIARQCRSL